MTYELSKQDWQDAEEALTGKPNGTTLSKYPIEPHATNARKIKWIPIRKHTFVIINEVIYALSNKDHFKPLKEENFTFKKGLTKHGLEVIIQIESPLDLNQTAMPNKNFTPNQSGIVDLFGFEEKILKSISHLAIQPKNYEQPLYPKSRIFTVIKDPSAPLKKAMHANQTLSPTQKMIYSLRICLLMQELHDQGFLYKNITAANFSAEIQHHNMQVKFNNFLFCQHPDNTSYSHDKILATTTLVGFCSPEVLSSQHFTVYSEYFSLAIMLLFQIDITGENIPEHHFDKYIEAACHLYSSKDQWMNPIEWIKNKKIKIDHELKNILFGMLHPNVGQRTGINHLIVYLCENLLLKNDLTPELIKECESLICRFKPASPKVIFNAFQLPSIFSPTELNHLFSESSKNKINNSF